jgi:DNA-directed RNA polymerase subunit L
MAAINPEKITGKVMKCSFTDLEIVFPILNSPIIYFETKKAAKLKRAAQSTAWKGVSTLVETIVAMELAASWNPLI